MTFQFLRYLSHLVLWELEYKIMKHLNDVEFLRQQGQVVV